MDPKGSRKPFPKQLQSAEQPSRTDISWGELKCVLCAGVCSSSGGRAGIFSDVTPLQCCHGSQQELLLPANSILSSMDVCVCVCLPAGWPPHCAADSPVWWGSGVCRWFWWQRLGRTSCAYLRGIKPQSESQTHSAVPECNQSNKLKNLNVRIGFHGFKHCKCNILQYSRFLERWLGKLWHLKNVSKDYLTLCPPGSPFNGSFSLPT